MDLAIHVVKVLLVMQSGTTSTLQEGLFKRGPSVSNVPKNTVIFVIVQGVRYYA